MSANVTLRTSAIDGIGVFAVHPFQRCDFVLEIDDHAEWTVMSI